MMGIGFPELMIILVIIMIIFGAGKLPEIGSAFGNSIRNFKKSMKEAEENAEELPETTDEAPDTAEVTEGDSDEPKTDENPVAATTEPEAK
jgi:sec-independent protein translocase protein TatA